MERIIKQVACKHKVDARTVRLLAGIGVGIDYTPPQDTKKAYPAPQNKNRTTHDFNLF